VNFFQGGFDATLHFWPSGVGARLAAHRSGLGAQHHGGRTLEMALDQAQQADNRLGWPRSSPDRVRVSAQQVLQEGGVHVVQEQRRLLLLGTPFGL
jgi:hypothetical protein